MNRIIIWIIYALIFLLVLTEALAQPTIVSWQFENNNGNETSLLANTTAENLSESLLRRGTGLSPSSLVNAFAATGWEATTLAEAITNQEYLEFDVRNTPGNSLSLYSLNWNFRRSSTGPNQMQWHYSIDGIHFTPLDAPVSYLQSGGDGQVFGPLRLSCVADLQDVTDAFPITFRLYAWGATESAGTAALGRLSGDDLTLYGLVQEGQLIAVQDFEVMARTPEFQYNNLDGNITTGVGIVPSGDKFVSCSHGFEANDQTAIISFDPIDTRAYSNLRFSFRLASFAGNSGNGADTSDEVLIEISEDGGASWSKELRIIGNNNSRWSFLGDGEAAAIFDGDDIPTDFQPAGGGDREDDGDAFSYIALEELPQAQNLEIRVTLHNDNQNEFWVVDDFKILGHCLAPFSQPTNLEASSVSGGNSIVSWNRGDGDEIIILASAYPISAYPSDGFSYSANAVYGLGDEIYKDTYIVYKGTGTNFTMTGLNDGENYILQAFEVNATDYCYLPPGTSTATKNGLQIHSMDTRYLIDFDHTIPEVNEGAFIGTGIAPNPNAGQLNSNAWKMNGFSAGGSNYGDELVSDDFARGISTGGVGTGGLYAFEIDDGNNALGVQPIGNDWTPGSFDLRIQNQTGEVIRELSIGYTFYVFNDQDRTNSFNFSYSTDGSIYLALPQLNALSPAPGTDPEWQKYQRIMSLSDISIAAGDLFYLRWEGNDVSGSGSRDEFALDDIEVIANPLSEIPQLQGEIKDGHIAGRAIINGNVMVMDSLIISDSTLVTSMGDTVILSGNAVLRESGTGYLEGNVKTSRTILADGNPMLNAFGGIGLEVNPTANDMGETTIVRVTGNRLNGESNGTPTQSLLRYFQVDPEFNVDLNAEIQFDFHPKELTYLNATLDPVAVVDPSQDLALYKRPIGGSPDQWVKLNGTVDIANHSIFAMGIDTFSEIALGDQTNAPLPVDWIDFIAQRLPLAIQLFWQTATEANNEGFEIQRSLNGQAFDSIGWVNGYGTTTVRQQYTFKDFKINHAVPYYYRLKQIDYDGQFEMGPIIFVSAKNMIRPIIYPNPVQHRLFIKSAPMPSKIIILNTVGHVLKVQQIANNQAPTSIGITDLSPGIYIVQLVYRSGTVIRERFLVR